MIDIIYEHLEPNNLKNIHQLKLDIRNLNY